VTDKAVESMRLHMMLMPPMHQETEYTLYLNMKTNVFTGPFHYGLAG